MNTEPKPRHAIAIDPHGPNGLTAMCLCGWLYWHRRLEVVKRAGERHLSKRGVA